MSALPQELSRLNYLLTDRQGNQQNSEKNFRVIENDFRDYVYVCD